MAKQTKEGNNLPANITQEQKAISEMFSVAKESVGEDLACDYFNFEQGEEVFLAFTGMTTMTDTKSGKDKEIEAVQFVDENLKKYINADAVIVSTCRKLVPITFLKIICTGEEDGKKGTYKKFNITKHGIVSKEG